MTTRSDLWDHRYRRHPKQHRMAHMLQRHRRADHAGVPGRGVRAGRTHQLARDYGGDSVQVVIADVLESFELHVAPL